jgi:hypothetical protein
MFTIACTLSGVSVFVVWIPAKDSPLAIGFAIMFGFTSGAFIGLSGALPISVSPLPEIGYRLGLVLTVASIGGAILQNSANGWLDVKIFGGAMCLTGRRLSWYRGCSIPRRNFSRCLECRGGTFIKLMEHAEGLGDCSGVIRFGLELGGTLVLIITIFWGCPISLVLTTVYYYLISRLLDYNPLQ